MTPFSIIFENDELLLINKPAGVSVQGGANIFHPLDEELSAQLGYKIHLVHRLDRETSGILVVAKDSASAAKWTKLFSQREVKKEYVAFCTGIPSPDGKETKMEGTLRGTVEAHGRTQTAELHYKVESVAEIDLPSDGKTEDRTPGTDKITLSKIRIRLGTGRMHQIRIQMAKAGAPLAGDDKHGDFKANKRLRKIGIKKLCLAAVRLTLPLDGTERTFEIPLPDHMEKIEREYKDFFVEAKSFGASTSK